MGQAPGAGTVEAPIAAGTWRLKVSFGLFGPPRGLAWKPDIGKIILVVRQTTRTKKRKRMWVCSKLGFFSIVKKGEPETWQVRTRRKNDLQELLEATDLDAEILSTPDGDYAFRIVVGREGLDRVFSCLAESIDYPNFKNCIADLPAQRDKLSAYQGFWSGMLKVQRAAPPPSAGGRRAETKAPRQFFRTNGGFWMRILIAIGGFKERHGHWPTKLHLSKSHIQELRDVHWTPLGFKTFESKLQLIAGNTDKYVAEDDAGLCFDYDKDEAKGKAPWDSAARWLWGVDRFAGDA